MKISQKQLESVLSLSREKRYKHFIKMIVDTEQVWGLYNEEWAIALSDDNVVFLPLWPAREYAQFCANSEWSNYNPKSVILSEFTSQFLPSLGSENVLLGIFFTPIDKGIILNIDELLKDIFKELEWYS